MRLVDREVANTETALRGVFAKMALEGQVLVVVDRLHSIGALSVTVAKVMGIDVAYLPGLSMRRLADRHPGNAKIDADGRCRSPGRSGRTAPRPCPSRTAR